MKVLSIIILAVGALISYLARFIYKVVKKEDATDGSCLKIKLVGVVIFLVGLVMTIVYFR